jgi:hypothetical protein
LSGYLQKVTGGGGAVGSDTKIFKLLWNISGVLETIKRRITLYFIYRVVASS